MAKVFMFRFTFLLGCIYFVGLGCVTEYPEATNRVLLKRSQVSLARHLSSQTAETSLLLTTSDGWTIPPPVAVHNSKVLNFEINPWFVAAPPASASPRHLTRSQAWETIYRQLQKWQANGDFARLGIEMIEPEMTLQSTGFKKRSPPVFAGEKQSAYQPHENRPRSVTIGKGPSHHWPAPKPYRLQWQFEDEYSQLKKARFRVEASGATSNGINVVVLDTGARTDFDIIPEHYQIDQATNLLDSPTPPNEWSTHGTATTSILAGGRIRTTGSHPSVLTGFDGYFGANPWVNISTYRISSWVVSIGNVNSALAEGIRTAVDRRADVISLSNGGLPSFAWADQVNYAYHNGAAIFAASGDYVNLLNIFQTPRRVVYPAAFSRVMCVPAATSNYKSYGEIPSFWSFLRFQDWLSYFVRGSYGPSFMMDNAVCGFSPNVLWVGDSTNAIDLDGAGTSSSTPQVAAAATLWLQFHRHDPELEAAQDWQSHKKVDAVYYALKNSARRDKLPLEKQRLFFGCGTLAAADALNLSYPGSFPPEQISYPDARVDLFRLLAILTDWFPVVHSVEEVEALQFDDLQKHMVLEALQIIYSSKKVLKLLQQHEIAGVRPFSPSLQLQKTISELILESPEASPTLKSRGATLRRSNL